MSENWIESADRTSDWSRANVLVAGLGVTGMATADALLDVGAHVTVVDENDGEANAEKAKILEILDGDVRLGKGTTAELPRAPHGGAWDLVVTSPGWRPTQPMLAAAMAQGIPVWGEIELAYRLQHPDRVVPWVAVTGTNGKTTTTQMVESIFKAQGLRTSAVGNIGRPLMEAILDDEQYDVLAVELSSFQLHWTHSVSLHSAAVLNLQADHLEWYPDMTSEQAYAAYGADKAKIYERCQHACVYNVADPATETMVENADVIEGARAIGFTNGIPAISMIGVVDELIVDRAFVEQRRSSAMELCSIHDVHPFAPHNIENALAAAALTRSFGVSPQAVREGLQNLSAAPHKIEKVATIDGVTYVDDSKATNPHAADAALRAFDSVVWIAGGQAKGTTFDDLVRTHRERLRAAVVLGIDAPVILAALREHAPDVPVVHIEGTDTGAMARAVERAAQFAQDGDTVLMAPGCASRDMWSGYDVRGNDFQAAVRTVGGRSR